MRWVINSEGSTVSYTGYAESSPVDQAVAELWRRFTVDAAPKNTEIIWDHLRVELWLDSGRIIIYPAKLPFRYRVEKAVCQMVCPDLLDFYETLIVSGVSDEKFESALKHKEREISAVISAAGRELNVPGKLAKKSVKIFYYGADLQNPTMKEVIENDAISSTDIFVSLVESGDEDGQRRIRSGHASEDVWFEIIEKRPDLLRAVTLNKHLPEKVLRALASNSDADVRFDIAMRRALPSDLFEKLANDPDESVRSRIAWNAKTPKAIRLKLSEDQSQLVREFAKKRIACFDENG